MPSEHTPSVRIHIYHEGDDDPDRCSALRLADEGYATLHETYSSLPDDAVALDPYAERALSPSDADAPTVVVFDSSWRSAGEVVSGYPGSADRRALPFVVAANPVSYGRAFRLNTAEAIIAALRILGHDETASAIASLFDYGETFLELNREPLERYSECGSSDEVVAVQEDYLSD